MADWLHNLHDKLHPSIHVRRLAGMGVVTVAMAILAWTIFNWLAPPQDNPFKPIDLTRTPGLATGFKLDRLAQDAKRCFAVLDEAKVGYTQISLEGDRAECNHKNAITLDRSLTPYSATLSMSCPLAAALYTWERHAVIPAAKKHFGQTVSRIETFGAYSCRRVNGARTGNWSEHAAGNAVDIAGFRLASGRVIMVKEWFGKKTPEGEFLNEVRDEACSLFSATLSPDYNAFHADHLHLDMGLWTTCS